MKRMLLTISYDGTAYHGWQVQPNGITVQEKLQDCLEKLMGTRPKITGCSRTDAGVHAEEFCLHFDCDDCFPEGAFLKGLNSILPNDIAHYRSFIFPDAMVRFYKKSPMDQDVQCLLENNSFEFYFIYEHKAIEIIQELNQVVFQQPKQQYYEYKITTLL
ncbi:MAG: hypothetical protein U0L84_05660, partial [Acutalibacteraceae bacterium]|nr:hypothetical protein [Acutalibacteraceae bacterium]